MSDQTIHRRWLSRVRVRVWGLMVVVLSVAIGLSWIVRSSRVQRDAAAAIEKTGGEVFYDWEWKDGSPVPNGKPWSPKWLTDLIGVDYFGHVVWVVCANMDRMRR